LPAPGRCMKIMAMSEHHHLALDTHPTLLMYL
jgi:hypothetical protein